MGPGLGLGLGTGLRGRVGRRLRGGADGRSGAGGAAGAGGTAAAGGDGAASSGAASAGSTGGDGAAGGGAAAASAAPAAVRRMGGEDSGFLALELPEQPMTNLYLVVLGSGGPQPPAPADVLTLGALRDRFAERIDILPALRWRLAPVPGGLHHPVWYDDPHFQLDRHLRLERLAPPGDEGQLHELCGRLAGEALDRSRPLWDATLVDGLAGGRQAIVIRAHHCLMDGAATLTTLARLFDDGGAGGDDAPAVAFAPGLPPARGELVRAALRDQATNLRQLPKLLARTRRAWKAKEEHDRVAAAAPPRSPHDVPPCQLNGAFGPRRHYVALQLELADLKAVREAAGVAFTDVALAVVAGALRTLLLDAGGLPARPLVAGCPVSGEGGKAFDRQWGNRFSNVYTSLATDLADPWERLQRIALVTGIARRGNELLGDQLWADWFDTLPPFLTGPVVRRHHRRRRRLRDVVDANVTVSIVPGPAAAAWRVGALEVEGVWMSGPPNNGIGVMVAFFTLGGRVGMSAVSIEHALPDPPAFAAAAEAALAELVGRARRAGG